MYSTVGQLIASSIGHEIIDSCLVGSEDRATQ
jgi:hypothetical protein